MPKHFTRHPYYSQEHDSWVIPLTQGVIALVDEDVAHTLGNRHWHAFSHRGERWYAVTNERPEGSTKQVLLRMHRIILEPPSALDIDHRKHFPFADKIVDNRRANLRMCTRALNALNRRKQRGRRNSFKGVLQISERRFRAYITVNKNRRDLGYHSSAIEAAAAYDKAARELHGEFAMTNASLGLMPEVL